MIELIQQVAGPRVPAQEWAERKGRYLLPTVLLLASSVMLLVSMALPYWTMVLHAPQYPQGLRVQAHLYRLDGDVQEIDTLNHYIGMRPIDRASLADLDWLPFAFGALVLLALRVAAIGNVRALLDLTVLTTYVSLFAFGRFAYMLYRYGHDLSPDAPVKVEGFMPALLGTKQIANFTTHSWPQAGSGYLAVFVVGVVALCGWHLVAGRRRAVREAAGAAPGAAVTV